MHDSIYAVNVNGATVRLIVLDTNVVVSALLSGGGASREVLRRCIQGIYRPLLGAALFAEYESVMAREALFRGCALSASEREAVFDALLGACRWTQVYYLWRPNLPDESDNHIIELAVAGGAEAVVTGNVKDFRKGGLRFPRLAVLTPRQLIEE